MKKVDGIPFGLLDARYLQVANNLSDLDNAGTARTNLGLVAGGAGDIWVEKAGDTMTGALQVDNNILIGGSNNELRFYEGANYVGFEAPALAADQIWVLPNADGGANEFLQTDGGGNLTWAAAGGSSPWTTDANVVNLVTDTDTVTIGSAVAGGKLFVDGDDATEVQLMVQGAVAQSAATVQHQTSNADVHNEFFVAHASNLYTTVFNKQGSALLDFKVLSDTADAIWVDASAELVTLGTEVLALNKILLTQTDGDEYIDSLNDGYMDYGATTQHRFDAPIKINSTTDAQLQIYNNASDICYFYVDNDGVLFIKPTSKAMWLGDGSDGNNLFALWADTSTYTLEHIDDDGALRLSANDATNYTQFADDGIMTMAGTARVTKYEWISASGIKSAGLKAASVGVNGNGFIVWSFADGQEQRIQYNLKIPDDMDVSEDCYLCFGWSSPTTSQTLVYDVTYLITAVNDSTEQAGTAVTGNTATSSGTADGLIVSPGVTIAGGTITDEVCIHVIFERDGNNGSDTLGAVMELHGIALQYIANKLGVAT